MTPAIELDREQSMRVLQDACRGGCEIQLRPKAWSHEHILRARLEDGEGETLKALCELPEEQSTSLVNMYCEFEITLADGRYLFDSHVLSVRRREARVELTVAWPRGLLVHQRRRASRTAMASSSSVQLSRQEGDQLLSCEGQLYNLCKDGLAFKIGLSEARLLDCGQEWCVCFEVPEQGHCYKLKAAVSRKLPSSDRGAVIVGLEFGPDPANHEDLEQLGAYLDQRQRKHSSMGVAS